jgi:hypothetical protein
MEDVELKEVLGSFKDAIDIILARLDRYDEMYHAQDERIEELEKTFYEDILEPARKALDERIYEDEYSKFHDSYGEKLDPYNEQLRAIEGEDFDLSRKAFEDYSSYEEKPDLDEYVNALVETVGNQLKDIKDKLGIEGDIRATVDEEGKVEVEVNDETVAEDKVEEDVKVEDEKKDGEGESEIVEDDLFSMIEDDPSEIEKFEKELEQYK